MTKEQIEFFRVGYWECRQVIAFELKNILAASSDPRLALEELLSRLKHNESEELWRDVQEEFPGITREEYEAQIEQSCNEIRKKFYRKDSRLKLRLVRNHQRE